MPAARAALRTGSRSASRAPRPIASSSSREISNGTRSSVSGSTPRSRVTAPSCSGGDNFSARPVGTDDAVQPSGPSKSTSRRAASSVLSVRFASASISAQACAEIGACSRSRSFISAGSRCRGSRRRATTLATATFALGFLFDLQQPLVREQVCPKVLIQLRSWRRSHSSIMAACSFSSSRLCARSSFSS